MNTEDLGPEIAARFLAVATSVTPPAVTVLVDESTDLAGIYRNVANDAAVEAKSDAAGLHFNGGSGFVTASRDRLVTADRRRTATVVRDRTGKVTGVIVTRNGNSPTTLERAAAWRPTRADAARLSGNYSSREVDGVQGIEATGADLLWRDPSGTAHKLVPTYRNAFDAPDASWTLRFQPSQRGQTVLEMSITRARHITFHRTGT